MLNIKEIELNDKGQIVALKGDIKPSKVFCVVTDKVIWWADYELDYAGG